MLVLAIWNFLLAAVRRLLQVPSRRRRMRSGFTTEAFEPRRLLSAFFVNSLADTHDANPGDGIAADVNGMTTLRSAVEEANALLGADTIQLPAGAIVLDPDNGPLTVSDDTTLLGSANGRSVIDGSAFGQVFEVVGSANFSVSNIRVRDAHELAASVRSSLLTSNSRQADLVIAFTFPASPLAVETKTSSALASSSNVAAWPDTLDDVWEFSARPTVSDFDPSDFSVKPDSSVIPTPDAAVEEIVNALFQREAIDFVVPIAGEHSLPMRHAAPVSNDESPRTLKDEALPGADAIPIPEDMMSDTDSGDRSQAPAEDEAVETVLRGWADEAGWNEFDFLTSGSRAAVAVRSTNGRRVAVAAALFVGSASSEMWTRGTRWLRTSLSSDSWRRRFLSLRRKPR